MSVVQTSRAWLNEDADAPAFVLHKVEMRGTSVYANFKVGDCCRTIELSFWVGDSDDGNDAVTKIDRLIHEAQVFRRRLLRAISNRDRSKGGAA